jgi:hypothetical protein
MSNKRNPTPMGSPVPLILIGSGLVLIIGILLWQVLTSPQLGSVNNSASSGSTSSNPTVDLSIPYSNVQRVSLADAKAAFDSKSAIFVDVRDADVYAADHIQGALNIPLGVFDAQYTQLDPNQWIILYCT